MSDPTWRPYNPQACVAGGERVGIFIGAEYRYLTVEQAMQLREQLDAAIAQIEAGAR